MKPVKFTHLHLHTEYSLLDGANQIKTLAKKVKELGMDSVAITDHGNMFGTIDFYTTMKREGVKPIIGIEAYIHNNDNLGDKSTRQRNHLCLYAKNEVGYRNLMYLSSQSYINGFYYYPRINKKILKENSEGLICSSACLQGEINWHLNQDEKNIKFGSKGYEEAKKIALWYKDVFGDDFYLEMMRHGIKNQKRIDDLIIKLSIETGIKIIATNDTHYINRDNANAHEVFMCIAMGKELKDPKRLKHSVHEFYIKSPQEMMKLFSDIPEAIANTQEIVDKCNLEIKLGNPTPPNFKFTLDRAKDANLKLPEPDKRFSFENDKVLFEYKAKEGLRERLKFVDKNRHKEYKDRLQTEIDIINSMKFSGYMLIVWDFVREARKMGVPVGPGRGCLTKDAKVYIYKNDEQEFKSINIDEVKIGDYVLTHNNSIKKVKELFKYKIKEELITISTEYGDTVNRVTLTKDHKLYLGDGVWKEAENITLEDWLILPIPKISKHKKEKIVSKLKRVFEKSNSVKFNKKFKAEEIRELLFMVGVPSYLEQIDNFFLVTIPTKFIDKTPKERDGFYKIEDNYLKLKVNLIKKIESRDVFVYDFKVEDKHSYTTTNYTVHNSAAGSLVAYSLEITDLDPIPYNLLFERFLNPERVSMPDIDIDFCQIRRQEILDYVIEAYGKNNVAQIITFNKLLAKGVIRDVARVMSVPYEKANNFAKLIPDKAKTLQEAYNMEPKIGELINRDKKIKEVWDFALLLEGLKRNAGTHAAGVVISNEELWKKTPLFKQSGSETVVTQYDGKYIEDVDLIKFDFLGLKTLTVIQETLDLIEKRYGKKIDLKKVDIQDKEVYKYISEGHTLGIFQIESQGMKNLARELKPSNFEDIIAMIALYRPGPMESGMDKLFVDRKHGRNKIEYLFDELKPILDSTYGVIVYQEQVIQIVQVIGGFSLGVSDLVRRAMGKKDSEKMNQLREEFLDGAEKNGFDREKTNELWESIIKFAGYGFNKSHSAAYALITFYTAYLKVYYPTEFMAAQLTLEKDNTKKVVKYVEELKNMDIDLLPPDINRSGLAFIADEVDGKQSVIFGLSAIKGIGESAVNSILEVRGEDKFVSLSNFISKIDHSKITRKVIESLIKAGALDQFGYSRRAMLSQIDKILKTISRVAKAKEMARNSLFGDDEEIINIELHLEDMDEFSKDEILDLEKETLGFYVSGHPLDKYKDEISKIEGYVLSSEIDELEDNSQAIIVGKVDKLEDKKSKKGNRYVIVTLIDLHGNIELSLIQEKYIDAINSFNRDNPIAFKVKIQKGNKFTRLNVLKVLSLSEASKEKIDTNREKEEAFINREPIKISIPLSSDITIIDRLLEITKQHPGDRPLELCICSKKMNVILESKIYINESILDVIKKSLNKNSEK